MGQNIGGAYYDECANEGQVCRWGLFDSPQNVAYGANGKYHFRDINGKSVLCSNDNFADPAVGVPKKCYRRIRPGLSADDIRSKGSRCAAHGRPCFTGSANSNIFYGSGNNFAAGSVDRNSAIICDNRVFGTVPNSFSPSDLRSNECFIVPF